MQVGAPEMAMQQGRRARTRFKQFRRQNGHRLFQLRRDEQSGGRMRGICNCQTKESKLDGVFVRVIWAGFHICLFVEPTQAVSVLCQWVWTYLTSQRSGVVPNFDSVS